MARPTFKPTAAQRRKVAIAAGAGMSHEEIALGLGISRNTLAKHFDAELSSGACAKRLEVLDAMFSAAKKGNVTAQKAYVAMTPNISAPALEKPVATKEGKKQQAQAEAVVAQVGSDWESLLPGGSPLQ
jgi:predicted transcriptional regulator